MTIEKIEFVPRFRFDHHVDYDSRRARFYHTRQFAWIRIKWTSY